MYTNDANGEPFWKRRTKHGRPRLFTTPEYLWEAACEYFQYCNENPWVKRVFVGKDALPEEVPTAKPYTITGLCLFLGCGSSYWRNFKLKLATENPEFEYKISDNCKADFAAVIEQIEETIYTQKFEGAAVGAFNANIISRDLGLVDKQSKEIKTEQEVTVTLNL